MAQAIDMDDLLEDDGSVDIDLLAHMVTMTWKMRRNSYLLSSKSIGNMH
jgi:hypothetical protein